MAAGSDMLDKVTVRKITCIDVERVYPHTRSAIGTTDAAGRGIHDQDIDIAGAYPHRLISRRRVKLVAVGASMH